MRTWILSAAVLVLLGCLATPAWAAEGGEQPGLLDIDLWAMITTIVVFLLLLFVLTKFAWRPILDGLHRREQTIKQALDDAQAAHDEAKALIADYQGKLETAREEAAAIADEARRDGEDIRQRIQEEARKDREETVARARREVEQVTAKAWEQIVHDAATIATQAAAKIVGTQLDSEGHAGIVSEVVSEFARERAERTGA